MNKNIISALSGALLSVGVFALAYFFLDQSHIDKFLPRTKIEGLIYFPMLIIAPLSAIAVHELGHLLTGLALGQKLKLFIVAFLGIKEEDGRIKLFFNKNLSLSGGIAATVPKTKSAIHPTTFSKIIIAGPVFSLAYFLVSLVVFLKHDSYFNSFFALSALTSLGMFLATTLPDKSGIMFTDRKRFQRLNSKGIIREVEIVLYELTLQSIIDNTFKNIDIEKVSVLDNDQDVTTKFWAAYLRFMFYKENELPEKREQAFQDLLTIKQQIPKSIWNMLKID